MITTKSSSRILKSFLMAALMPAILSCSKEGLDDGSEYLAAKITPKSAIILPLDDLTKCSSSSTKLSPNILEFSNIALTWSGKTSFRLISMALELNSSVLQNGKYQCNIAGNELIALMPTRTVASDCQNDACILSSTSFCSLRCGQIQIVSGAKSATIPGKIKVLGIETDSDDNVFPVTKEFEVSARYTAF